MKAKLKELIMLMESNEISILDTDNEVIMEYISDNCEYTYEIIDALSMTDYTISLFDLKRLYKNINNYMKPISKELVNTPLFYNKEDNLVFVDNETNTGDCSDFFEIKVPINTALDIFNYQSDNIQELIKCNDLKEDEHLFKQIFRPCHHNLLTNMIDYGCSFESSMVWRFFFKLFGFVDVFPMTYSYDSETLTLQTAEDDSDDIELFFSKEYILELDSECEACIYC